MKYIFVLMLSILIIAGCQSEPEVKPATLQKTAAQDHKNPEDCDADEKKVEVDKPVQLQADDAGCTLDKKENFDDLNKKSN